MIVMILAFFLGCYQLLSGLIGSIRGNRKKLVYFVAALIYMTVLIGVSMYGNLTFIEPFEVAVAVIGWILIPMGFAVYYTKLCYDLIKA
jgi:LytS/YehU family sensor histidine kinase